jgi:integrase
VAATTVLARAQEALHLGGGPRRAARRRLGGGGGRNGGGFHPHHRLRRRRDHQLHRHHRLFTDGREEDALVELGGSRAQSVVDIVFGGAKPLTSLVTAWASVRATEVERKTADMDLKAVREFTKAFPLLSDVSRPAVVAYLDSRKQEVSASTTQRECSGLRSYWSFLRQRGEASYDAPDPFANLSFKSRKKDAARARRVAFTPAEVSKLYKAALANRDQPLADLIALAAYSGARREEIGALTVDRVDLKRGWITIVDGKSADSNRSLPIHPDVLPVLRRMIGGRKDGFVFVDAEETGNKYGKRSDAAGKRFSRLRDRLGFTPQHVLHSLRHTVSQQLRAAGTMPDIVSDILGHRVATMGGGVYGSPEARRKLLPAAVAKLAYPGALKAPR